MAWVSVHDNVIGGKLRELAKEIGCTQEEALGILVSLWIWGLNNADKDGKLMSADREDVLEAFSVKLVSGLKVDIVDTLVKTRWMDEPEPGVLYIHDWDQWQEQWYKAIERREKDAKRKAEYRQGKRSEKARAGAAGKKNDGLDQEALWGRDGGAEAPAQLRNRDIHRRSRSSGRHTLGRSGRARHTRSTKPAGRTGTPMPSYLRRLRTMR